MPIYAYRCEACGFTRDVLQKISDAPLTDCSSCGKPAFKKQLTAAGFQLKGSGWYVTDFRGGATPAGAADGDKPAAPAAAAGPTAATTGDSGAPAIASDAKPAATSSAAPATTPSAT